MEYKTGQLSLEMLKSVIRDLYIEKTPKKITVSAEVHKHMNCEQLKVAVKEFHFIGGSEAVDGLLEKCKECGIEV